MDDTATTLWRDTGVTLDDLWEGDMVGVDVAGTPVLLVNLGGRVLAYANRCPHQASPLDEGVLDDTTLVCAKHMWEFDASTGRGINPDDTCLTGYGCQVAGDGAIQVDLGR